MSVRTDLIGRLTTDLTGTSVRVVSELPFDSAGNPLYFKNKKTVYVGAQDEEKIQLYRTLDQGDVYQSTISMTVFVTVDAKNEPSDMDSIVDSMLAAKDLVSDAQDAGSEVITDIEDDYITYSVDYTFTITN